MFISSAKNHIMPNFTANKMPVKQAEYFDNKLKSAKTVDIICHSLSDEDTFNSATTMYSYLQEQGVNPRIIVSGGFNNYNFNNPKYNIIQDKAVGSSTKPADVALCVDFSANDRISENVSKHLQKFDAKNVIGIDHHNNPTKISPNFNQITKSYKSVQDMPKLEPQNFYIDSSAKSNCGIIYRFFEALNKVPSKDQLKSMFCGMLDDTSKEGFVSLGKDTLKLTLKANGDFNTQEVFNSINSKLNDADRAELVNHLDVMSNLTDAEKAFKESLKERVKYSSNGKFAYIEIPNKDKEWEDLGKDTPTATAILKEFRKETLDNTNAEAVAVFYPTSKNNTYKMSMRSNSDYAKQIVDYIKENLNPSLVAGGHDNRNGGTLDFKTSEDCKNWVNDFKTAAEHVL